MVEDSAKVTTYGETPVPDHRRNSPAKADEGLECPSTTKRVMNKATENRVLITLWIAIVIYVGSQLMETRDSSMTHELRITRIETDITEIKGDVKSLLGRSQHNAKP